jgi:hypothetical protein
MLRLVILYCLLIFTFGFKTITIQPGGLKGFYVMGICKYIKENYCLEHYDLYGSSAGSWNALYLSLPLDDSYYFDKIIKIKPEHFSNLYELENCLKDIITNDKKMQEIDNHIASLNQKCNICISEYNCYKFKKLIKSDFHDYEDLLQCCIASSHLPFLSNGDFFYTYQTIKAIDGGLFQNNYPNHIEPDLLISHKMFRNKEINKYSTRQNLNIEKLIYEGYKDAMGHPHYFDKKLIKDI